MTSYNQKKYEVNARIKLYESSLKKKGLSKATIDLKLKRYKERQDRILDSREKKVKSKPVVKKKDTLQSVDKKLDTVYSKYIRLLGAKVYKGTIVNKCFTCGEVLPVKKVGTNYITNGHYISRRYKNTKFDIHNTKPQCWYCNKKKCYGGLGGNIEVFRKRLISLYGEDLVLLLEASRSKRVDSNKYSYNKLLELLEYFTQKVNILLKNLGQ